MSPAARRTNSWALSIKSANRASFAALFATTTTSTPAGISGNDRNTSRILRRTRFRSTDLPSRPGTAIPTLDCELPFRRACTVKKSFDARRPSRYALRNCSEETSRITRSASRITRSAGGAPSPFVSSERSALPAFASCSENHGTAYACVPSAGMCASSSAGPPAPHYSTRRNRSRTSMPFIDCGQPAHNMGGSPQILGRRSRHHCRRHARSSSLGLWIGPDIPWTTHIIHRVFHSCG